MLASRTRLASGSAIALLMAAGLLVVLPQTARAQTAEEEDPVLLGTIVISAEEQIKQALGASTVTSDDLAKSPVVNDIAEIIRKQPGINLTGNSASGQRGNSRQLDIRGMGPENTLILIDGKPVMSRNAVRMGRQGERDTRGDSNWVPPELVERIEIIRGPAAARYGSGAAGGVINIITKRPEEFTGSVGLHFDIPQSSKEGKTGRTNFMLAGPVGETLSFRLFGNLNKSEGDDVDINAGNAAGVEGVLNKDIGALLTWAPMDGHEIDFEFNFSRQGNKYAGEEGSGSGVIPTVGGVPVIGMETNRQLRRTLAITHRGDYDFGESFSYLQWENTRDKRLCTGSSGGGEGDLTTCVDTDADGVNDAYEFRYTEYDTISGKTEWQLPGQIFGNEAKYTLGAEYRGEFMDDDGREFTTASAAEQHLLGLYAEANIYWGEKLTLTPGLRYDYSSKFGSNLSPSLNATYEFTDAWSMKLGLARAFKAPNLFQLNPDYYYNTMGMGCPVGVPTPCRIRGNADLDAEHSFNKEIGIAYDDGDGMSGSLTWFRNDYKNRIAADLTSAVPNPDPLVGGSILQWSNTPEAVIEGIEGNFATQLGEQFTLNLNFTKMITSINKQTGNPLSLVPEHTINASLDWYARDDLTLTLGATHYGKIVPPTTSLSTGAPITDPVDLEPRAAYTLVNFNMKWDISEATYLSAGVTNLFDKQILRTGDGADTFNEPGRGFYIGLNHSF